MCTQFIAICTPNIRMVPDILQFCTQCIPKTPYPVYSTAINRLQTLTYPHYSGFVPGAQIPCCHLRGSSNLQLDVTAPTARSSSELLRLASQARNHNLSISRSTLANKTKFSGGPSSRGRRAFGQRLAGLAILRRKRLFVPISFCWAR